MGEDGPRLVVITPELAEKLETVLGWAQIHVADTSTSRSTDEECYELIQEVADAFGVDA